MDGEVSRRRFLRNLGGGAMGLWLWQRGGLWENRQTDCPVYFFHEVGSERAFAGFVQGLLRSGRHPVSLSTLTEFLETGEQGWPEDKQPFVLTFDDGLLSQKRNAFPFLAGWSIPAVFAVMPGWPGDGRHRYMSNADLRELSDGGMEVISHTLHHANLTRLRRTDWGAWAAEVVESKTRLEDVTGTAVDFFCYPFGAYDGPTLDLVMENYRAALSTRPGRVQSTSELYLLRRERRS